MGFWECELAPQVPYAFPLQIYWEFPELPNSAKFPEVRDVGSGAPEPVASIGISGAGGSDLGSGDWQLAGPNFGQ